MFRIKRRFYVAGAAALLSFLLFFLWHQGNSQPLSLQEQQDYLAKLEDLPESTKTFINKKETVEFMASDDGKPFFVINIFKLKPQATYDANETLNSGNIGGYEAFRKFSRLAIPLWVKRGGYPVFATQLSDTFANEWDLVSVVRYRSRRDFMAIQTSDAFATALPHRLAATEANIRLKFPGLSLPSPLALLIVIWLAILLFYSIVHRTRKSKRFQHD